jgi:hypothetical protein
VTAGNAKADWRAVILDEDGKIRQAQLLKEKLFDQAGEIVERVAIFRRARLVAVAEAQAIRRDDAKISASLGMRSRNIWDDDGKPCSRTTAGAVAWPASR